MAAAHHPVATIVLAHFSVLMNMHNSNWWTKGWPERILHAASTLLEPIPELQDSLEWPLSCMSEISARDNTMRDINAREGRL